MEATATATTVDDLAERLRLLRGVGAAPAHGGAGAAPAHGGAGAARRISGGGGGSEALDSDGDSDEDATDDEDDEDFVEEVTPPKSKSKSKSKDKGKGKGKDTGKKDKKGVAESVDPSPARVLAGKVNALQRVVRDTAEDLKRSQVMLASARAAVVGTVTKPPTWTDSVMSRLFTSASDGTVDPEHATMALVMAEGDPSLMAAFAQYFVAKAEEMSLAQRLELLTADLEAAVLKHEEFKAAQERAAEMQRQAEGAAQAAYHAALLQGTIGGAGAGAPGRSGTPGRARAGSAGARARTPSRR